MSDIRHVPTAPADTRVLAGEVVGLHTHDDHQLIYASSDVPEVMVDSGTWFTPPTRAVWVPSGTAHHWHVLGSATVHLVGVPIHRGGAPARTPALVLVRPLFRELMIACSAAGALD